ncbi:MobC family plasmid mobilization relaxosome protein [Eubacterium maltosivorans]|uniref:MobC family plasmid mobilization relaxosome protein n=1 Tax=Eubacterium maltosivorans TaxID=2041044 RepID=UPI003A955C62
MSNDKREVYVPVRFTKAEYKKLMELAEKTNCLRSGKICISQYIRESALQSEKIVVVEDLKPVLTELKRIGTNVNQIAKLANMGQIKTVYLEETQNAFNQIVKNVMRIVEKV